MSLLEDMGPTGGYYVRSLAPRSSDGSVDWSLDGRARLTRLHVVADGEVSAHSRRKAYAHAVTAAQAGASARAVAALTTVATVFASAAVTMIWAFLAIPNTPLP
ncbi:MAG: hypothetical protein FWF43_08415 [Propionibacteriaceae bacterium]|nr:hypothetical protein [Propionibacteriaceae bacterium]